MNQENIFSDDSPDVSLSDLLVEKLLFETSTEQSAVDQLVAEILTSE